MRRSIRALFSKSEHIFSLYLRQCSCGRGSDGAENERRTLSWNFIAPGVCVSVLQMSLFVAAPPRFVSPCRKSRTRDRCTVRWPNVKKKNKKDVKICIAELEKNSPLRPLLHRVKVVQAESWMFCKLFLWFFECAIKYNARDLLTDLLTNETDTTVS